MMNDPILQAAERDLAELDAQRRELVDFIDRYRKYRAALPPSHGTEKSASNETLRRSAPVDEILSAIADIISERGDAVPLADLYDALMARGIAIGGGNPKQNLSQKLSADQRLRSYGRSGWYFADTKPPCAAGMSKSEIDRLAMDERDLAHILARPHQANGGTGSYPETPRGDRAPV